MIVGKVLHERSVSFVFGLSCFCSQAFSAHLADEVIELSQTLSMEITRKVDTMERENLQDLKSRLIEFIADVQYGGTPAPKLECRGGNKVALYNLVRNEFIDRYYARTKEECALIIEASIGDITCSSDRTGLTARINYVTGQWIDRYYRTPFEECIALISQ
jgi:hypothetical protein